MKKGVLICGFDDSGDRICLIKRNNTGYEDDLWSFPGGHIESRETWENAALREAREEINATLKNIRLKKRIKLGEWQHYYIIATIVNIDSIKNMECNKADDLRWFMINELPENISSHVKYLFKKNEFV